MKTFSSKYLILFSLGQEEHTLSPTTFPEGKIVNCKGHFKGCDECSYMFVLDSALDLNKALFKIRLMAGVFLQEHLLLVDNQRGATLLSVEGTDQKYLGRFKKLTEYIAKGFDRDYTYLPQTNEYYGVL